MRRTTAQLRSVTPRRYHVVRALSGDARRIDLGNGDRLPLPKRKTGFRPRLDLTKEQAVELQLQALRQNSEPYVDHGVEVLYRFAHIDPFARSKYFGVWTDLGQFERFRRWMHTEPYSLLIGHTHSKPLSSLQVSEFIWKQRIYIEHTYRLNESGIFEFTMIQKLGGYYDSYFFTESLMRQE